MSGRRRARRALAHDGRGPVSAFSFFPVPSVILTEQVHLRALEIVLSGILPIQPAIMAGINKLNVTTMAYYTETFKEEESPVAMKTVPILLL